MSATAQHSGVCLIEVHMLYYRHSTTNITLKLQVCYCNYRGSCFVFIQSLIGTIVSWFIFIIIALIGNIGIERDLTDTRRSYWSSVLQNSTCKLIMIMLPMHLHIFTETTHKPATSIPQKRAAINNISPVMVATMIQAKVQYDTLG